MNKYIEYIISKLDTRTLLEQLAEESAEFTQSTLKLIRAYELNNNLTPVNGDEAFENFREEYSDVYLVMWLLMLKQEIININEISDYTLSNPKLKRWAERLGYKE